MALSARPEHDRLSGERMRAHRGDDRHLLVDRRASALALGRQMIANNSQERVLRVMLKQRPCVQQT
jgi:hypothetical protein